MSITDRKGFNINYIDTQRIKALSTKGEDKKHLNDLYSNSFLAFRNAMLEIFPNVNGKYDKLSVEFAENFSFIMCEKFLPNLIEYITKELETVKASQQTQSQAQKTT